LDGCGACRGCRLRSLSIGVLGGLLILAIVVFARGFFGSVADGCWRLGGVWLRARISLVVVAL